MIVGFAGAIDALCLLAAGQGADKKLALIPRTATSNA